jgi:hypothetical protein
MSLCSLSSLFRPSFRSMLTSELVKVDARVISCGESVRGSASLFDQRLKSIQKKLYILQCRSTGLKSSRRTSKIIGSSRPSSSTLMVGRLSLSGLYINCKSRFVTAAAHYLNASAFVLAGMRSDVSLYWHICKQITIDRRTLILVH